MVQMMPPAAYISQPATGCASKFVHLSWNKVVPLLFSNQPRIAAVHATALYALCTTSSYKALRLASQVYAKANSSHDF